MLVIGVDGGGTKTHGVLVQVQVGQSTSTSAAVNGATDSAPSTYVILSDEKTSSTNPNSVGRDKARQTLFELFDSLLSASKPQHSKSAVSALCLTMSGVNRPEESELFREFVREYFGANVLVQVYNDAVGALASGIEDKLHGIVVISGTGMIAYGRNENNATSTHHNIPNIPSAAVSVSSTVNAQTPAASATSSSEVSTVAPPLEWYAGGNGALMDDGSGFWIGLSVCRSCFAAADGMGPTTPLLADTLSFLQIKAAADLIPFIYADGKMEFSRLASLAPLAFKHAARQVTSTAAGAAASSSAAATPARLLLNGTYEVLDEVSMKIIQNAADYLILSVRTVFNKLQFPASEPLLLVMSGSVAAQPLLYGLVEEGVKKFIHNLHITLPVSTTAEGAAKIAIANAKKSNTN